MGVSLTLYITKTSIVWLYTWSNSKKNIHKIAEEHENAAWGTLLEIHEHIAHIMQFFKNCNFI